MATKKRLMEKSESEEANREVAKQLAEKHAKEEAERLKMVQAKINRISLQINHEKEHFSGYKPILYNIKKNTEIITRHPMFRSKAGYFRWQLSALTWIYEMAIDITMYIHGELFKMQNMINAIKEE